MQRVVLVGAHGFVGKHLRQALQKTSYKVHIIASLQDYSDMQVQEVFKQNIQKNDIVVNLSGRFSLPFAQQIKTNVLVLQTLCEVCANAKVKKLIHVSTAAIYGNKKNPSEKDAPSPTTFYGLSKKLGEDIIFYYQNTNKLPFIIFRPVNIYGPGSTHGVIYEFVTGSKKGKVTIFGDGLQSRDFLYVDDMVDALVKAIATKKKNAIYNIGAGEIYSLQHVLALLTEMREKHMVIVTQPADTTVVRTLSVDAEKIAKELQWKPKILLKEGLQRVLAQ